MCITFVTVGELMKWRVLRSWGPSRTNELARWRQHVGVLAYDEAVAEKWGQLQARAQRRGRPRPQNDPTREPIERQAEAMDSDSRNGLVLAVDELAGRPLAGMATVTAAAVRPTAVASPQGKVMFEGQVPHG